MECKMSFLKYRVMKRLFLFAVCAWAGLSLWASGVKGQGTACETRSEKAPAKVYMIKEISPESLMKVYEALGRKATGKVAVKLSTGEPGNNNYLDPALIKGLVQKVDGTIVECNTLRYGKASESGQRPRLYGYSPGSHHGCGRRSFVARERGKAFERRFCGKGVSGI